MPAVTNNTASFRFDKLPLTSMSSDLKTQASNVLLCDSLQSRQSTDLEAGQNMGVCLNCYSQNWEDSQGDPYHHQYHHVETRIMKI